VIYKTALKVNIAKIILSQLVIITLLEHLLHVIKVVNSQLQIAKAHAILDIQKAIMMILTSELAHMVLVLMNNQSCKKS